MVRITRCYSIPQEIVHELQLRNIKNVSGLISDLLQTYLQLHHQEVNLEKKELERALLEKKAELMLLEQKQSIIRQKEEEADRKMKEEIASNQLIIIE